MNIITSIATLLLLLNDTLILRGCNLSAIFPRSTLPVETPKSDDVNCSAKFTYSAVAKDFRPAFGSQIKGDCVKEGGGEEGERERERALGLLLCHSPRH